MLQAIRSLSLLTLLVATLVSSPAIASAAAMTQVGDYDTRNDGNPDVYVAAGTWGEQGWLVFAISSHRGYLFAGEDVGVFIDTDGLAGSDYQIRLHQYADGSRGTILLAANNGGWMYLENGSTAGGYIADNGAVVVYVHSSDLGSPRSVNFAAYSHGGAYASAYDLVPNAGYWNLPAPTQVAAAAPAAGEQPPATDPLAATPVESGAPVIETPTDTESATPVAALNAGKARSAIRKHMKRRLPAGAKLTLSRCATTGATQYRCQVRATRRGRVWKGTATARITADGRYTASFSRRR